MKVSAQASPNIALIKYWGNRDHLLRIPANSSLSITLRDLNTTTHIQLDTDLDHDVLTINDESASEVQRQRASNLLAIIRETAGKQTYARVESHNSFPMGSGIASSASAFAALTMAGCAAYGLDLDLRSLSRMARRASGSAARSLCPGFVELHSSEHEEDSFAETIFPEDHWDLVDLIVVVDAEHKTVSSSDGHLLADSSPVQAARIEDSQRRLAECKQALDKRDFEQLARVVELDSNLMHAVMMSSTPPLLYWQPQTMAIMHAVGTARAAGTEVCYTVDAGPNVHCICMTSSLPDFKELIESLGVHQQIYISKPGPGANLL